MCIQTNTTLDSQNKPTFGVDDYYIKTTDEMKRIYGAYAGAIENTVKIADACQLELEFDKEALEAVATQAIERNTGARGLRSIMENLMMSTMYEIPSKDNVCGVLIDAECVTSNASPKLIEKELIKLDNQVSGQLE